MKLVLTLLGVILIVVAVVYFVMPADSLPGFFPGHEDGVTRMHYKHGMVSGVAGVILLARGPWFETRARVRAPRDEGSRRRARQWNCSPESAAPHHEVPL
jgi:hypothetical protein